MSNKIHLFWMYPDILNLHGDRGNIQAFEYVAGCMGLELEVTKIVNPDDVIDFEKADIMVFGPGELKACRIIANALEARKAQFEEYIHAQKHILVIGTSGAIFAKQIERLVEEDFDGLGLLEVTAKERKMILGDDLHVQLSDGTELMGSQIQMADYTVDSQYVLAQILYGHGNRAAGDEGARRENLIWTNLLGPVMVKNPWWAAQMLAQAAQRKGMSYTMPENSVFELELASLEAIKEYIALKKNRKD